MPLFSAVPMKSPERSALLLEGGPALINCGSYVFFSSSPSLPFLDIKTSATPPIPVGYDGTLECWTRLRDVPRSGGGNLSVYFCVKTHGSCGVRKLFCFFLFCCCCCCKETPEEFLWSNKEKLSISRFREKLRVSASRRYIIRKDIILSVTEISGVHSGKGAWEFICGISSSFRRSELYISREQLCNFFSWYMVPAEESLETRNKILSKQYIYI